MFYLLLIVHVCVRPAPTVIGFAMYYFTYDPWIGKLLYLEDFFVMKEYRGEYNVVQKRSQLTQPFLLDLNQLFFLSFRVWHRI